VICFLFHISSEDGGSGGHGGRLWFFFYSLSTSLHGLRVEKKKNTREIEFFGVAGMDDGMQNFYGIYK
jgi:hypothetical protein